MNNKVIKNQRYREGNPRLSNLFLKNGSIPFDEMPFCASLVNHNPTLINLFECIDINGRKYELLARKIKNNSEVDGYLYVGIEEIKDFLKDDNVDDLIQQYHHRLYKTHRPDREIRKIHNKFLYIYEYENTIKEIMALLGNFIQEGIKNYQNNVEKWLNEKESDLDSEEKKDCLKKLFCNSKLALIYGAAGTGKTTMIEHISDFFWDKNKLYLANTHTAVNNLRQRLKSEKSEFSTIASMKKKQESIEYDIVIIDECSAISNADIKNILWKIKCDALICVGDIYQIEAIRFGNWFLFAQKFFSDICIELKSIYRTEEERLKVIWERARVLDDGLLEAITKNNSSKRLDISQFERKVENSIVLCLNYGGIYGVNNINKLLQESNPKPSYQFNGLGYKIDDPVLFNESSRFGDSIHNNLKGIISDIKESEQSITFTIKTYKNIEDDSNLGFKIISKEQNYTEIEFEVYRHNTDEEDKANNIVPFQIAYAISIHKAQGLEYDNVFVVVSNEIEEQITHNIFYTAITRAKKCLTIYWSPETEKKVLESLKSLRLLKIKNIDRDYNLLRNRMPNAVKP